MTTLIIMGHGRVAADETMTVPDGCTLNFYAPQGYAISKGYAGKVMTDALPPSERYVSGAILSKHYLCPSLDIEITARFRKAAHYRDKTDAWVIQLKNHPGLSPACRDQGVGDCVDLIVLKPVSAHLADLDFSTHY